MIDHTSWSWGLALPTPGVSRRLSRSFTLQGPGPHVLGELPGPGAIRQIWVTGSNIGRELVLRIWFDDQPTPAVEAPLADFFGVMHNLAERGEPYRLNTPFLSVKPHNGFTCSFPMPFARGARVEVEGGASPSRLYYMIDWHAYPNRTLDEPRRFCARWRREAPTRDRADDYLVLDADGPGRLAGLVYSVDMIDTRHTMRWSHGGADNIYIDGGGDHPAYLRGIGGEDTFGTSFGGAEYPAQTSLLADMPYYVQKDAAGDRQKLVGYRFFVHDAIHFERSLHVRFGCRSHDIASIAYWYAASPVRPFFCMPPIEQRIPDSELVRGEHDQALPDHGAWRIAGPFPLEFDEMPSDPEVNFAEPFHGQRWSTQSSLRGFLDFNHAYRPEPTNANSPTLEAAAVARCVLECPHETTARITVGWDDHLLLRINDNPPVDMGRQPFFDSRTFEVPMGRGPNVVAVRLTNAVGLTRGSWCLSFRATSREGEELIPRP